jgi:hypothetical protein
MAAQPRPQQPECAQPAALTRALDLMREGQEDGEQLDELQLELDHYRQVLADAQYDTAGGEGRW